MSCGQAHSQARQLVAQGSEAKLVAETVGVSRSSLYYRPKPRASRADRSQDEAIIVACGDKPAYGYRRVSWWLWRKQGLTVNGKRVLRVMRERGLLVAPRRLRARRQKEWGRVIAEAPNQVWQSDMTKVWAGANVGWAYLVSVIDCCTREIVGWDLSLRCRTQEAIAAVECAVLQAMADGSRGSGLVLTTDNGTQFTSTRFVETLSRPGIHPSPGLQPPGRQRTDRTLPPQLKRGRDLAQRIPQSRRSHRIDRSLDHRVQSRSPASGAQKPHLTRSPRGLRSTSTLTKNRGPLCLVLKGALHMPPCESNVFGPAK